MLIKTLMEKSSVSSTASRFTSFMGLVYLGTGLLICAAPAVIPVAFVEPAFACREEGLLRVCGWIMAVGGGFLWAGGRTGARSFVAASIVARLLVPIVLVPVAMAGVFPHVMYAFAVLDPASALVTWYLSANSETDERPRVPGAHDLDVSKPPFEPDAR